MKTKSEKAVEFLSQVEKIDCLIKNKRIEIQQWKDAAVNITGNMETERVQATSSQQKMADAVNNYVDLEREIIKNDIIRLNEKKKEIISVIEQLPALHYDILHMCYIQGLDLKEIAYKLEKSYSTITTHNTNALAAVEKILIEREKEQ